MADDHLDLVLADIRRAFDGLRDDMRDGFTGVHTRLDAINGRVRATEIEIGVLRERTSRAAVTGGAAGTVGGGIVAGVVYALKLFGVIP